MHTTLRCAQVRSAPGSTCQGTRTWLMWNPHNEECTSQTSTSHAQEHVPRAARSWQRTPRYARTPKGAPRCTCSQGCARPRRHRPGLHTLPGVCTSRRMRWCTHALCALCVPSAACACGCMHAPGTARLTSLGVHWVHVPMCARCTACASPGARARSKHFMHFVLRSKSILTIQRICCNLPRYDIRLRRDLRDGYVPKRL